jgi:hypothetical protein
MKKTLLATMIASSLALTGCNFGETKKEEKPVAPVAVVQLADKTASLESAYATITDTKKTAVVAQEDTIKAAITKIETKIELIKKEDDSDAKTKDLTAWEAHLKTMQDIQKVILADIEAVEANKIIEDAANATLTAKLEAYKITLEKDNETLKIEDIQPMVTLIDAIAKMDEVATKNEAFKAVFERFLAEQYEAVNLLTPKLKPAALKDFDQDVHTAVAELRTYITIVEAANADLAALNAELAILDGAYKAKNVLTQDAKLPAYVTAVEAVFGSLKEARANNAAIVAAIVDADVKAFVSSKADQKLSALVIKEFKEYNGTAATTEALLAEVDAETAVDKARLQSYAAQLHMYVNAL